MGGLQSSEEEPKGKKPEVDCYGNNGKQRRTTGDFDLQEVARANILELVPYRCARDVSHYCICAVDQKFNE